MNTPNEINDLASSYIRRIRNLSKRTYANMYWHRIKFSQPTDDLPSFGLSYMARQAVRMRLDEMLGHAR